MNKIIILMTMLLSINTHIECMKRTLSIQSEQSIKKQRNDDNGILVQEHLPFELQAYIVVDLLPQTAGTSHFRIICNTIHFISYLNKKWNVCINTPKITHGIINRIIDATKKNFYADRFMIAKAIETTGAKNYIAQSLSLYHKVKGKDLSSGFSVEQLIEKGADVNFEHPKGNCLHLAVFRGNYTLSKGLLEAGANPNTEYDYETPLECAIQHRDLGITQLLLQYNPHNMGLLAAVECGSFIIMKHILQNAHLTQSELKHGYDHAILIDPNFNNETTQLLHAHYFKTEKNT